MEHLTWHLISSITSIRTHIPTVENGITACNATTKISYAGMLID